MTFQEELISTREPVVQFFACDDAFHVLDTCHDLFQCGRATDAVEWLVAALYSLRKNLSSAEWELFKRNWAYHPVAPFVLEDPFTNWSYRKPRGYSGDACLI